MTDVRIRTSPYVGLVPYSEDDYDLFFGRRQDTERVAANLFGPRLTLLYGRSGVGKSSLVNAGVLPRVNDGTSSIGVVFRDWSQEDRFERIVSAVESRMPDRLPRVTPHKGPLAHDSASSEPGGGFADQVHAIAERVPVQIMILLDQFEDYFLYVPEVGVHTDREFARALTSGPANVSYLLAIREDSLALLDRFKGLVPGLFDNYLRIDPLDREAAEEAIVKPLEVFVDTTGEYYTIEDNLVSAILDDIEGEIAWRSDRLSRTREIGPHFEAALLQLVMQRLWDEETAGGRHTLRMATYVRLKRSRAIVRSYLDRVMVRLGPDGKRLAYHFFGELVTASGDKVAHRVEHLAERAFTDPDEIQSLLQQLVNERVLRIVDLETHTYEIYHDILAKEIRKWRDDYERDTDPFVPARKSLERRLAHAVELAKSDSREDQLQAIRSLTGLGRSRVDPVIPEQARAALRRVEKSAAVRSFVDLGGGRQVQNAATVALKELELDRVVLSIQESLRDVQTSADAAEVGEFERDQIRRGVHTVEQGVRRLLGYLKDDDTSVRRSAYDAIYEPYLLMTQVEVSLSYLGQGFREYGESLRAMAEKCAEAIASLGSLGLETEPSEEAIEDAKSWSEGDAAEWVTSTNPWLAETLAAVLAVVLATLTFRGVEWILNATLAGHGWVRPSGAAWVLLAAAVVLILIIRSMARDEASVSGLLDLLLTLAAVGIVLFLAAAVYWYLGNLLGVMAYSTFGFSLTWSTYVSLAALLSISYGLFRFGEWITS